MERFALKIDSNEQSKVYRLCRLCGIDHPQKVNILKPNQPDSDEEPNLFNKIRECVGLKVTAFDRMPQNVCLLCVDRVNDIYEYRLMCEATQVQTRKLLGMPEKAKRFKPEVTESILGLESKKEKHTYNGKKTATKPSTIALVAKAVPSGLIKTPLPASLPSQPMVSIAIPSTSGKKQPDKLIEVNHDEDLLVPMEMPPQVSASNKRKRVSAAASDAKLVVPLLKVPKLEDDAGLHRVWCRVCRVGQTDQKALDTHMSTEHLPKVFRWGCSTCMLTFRTQSDSREHHQWHTRTGRQYVCRMCNKHMAKLQALTYHNSQCPVQRLAWNNCVKLPDVHCAQCDRQFRTQNLYDWHGCFMRVNGQCPRCGRHFVRKQMLFRHTVKCDGAYTSGGTPAPATEAPAVATAAKVSTPEAVASTSAAQQQQQQQPATKAKRYVAAMKMEPETMLDVDEDADGDYRPCGDDDDGGGGGHHNDDSDSADTSTASEADHWSAIRVKNEHNQPRARAAAAAAAAPAQPNIDHDDDDDDDVIFVQTEPTESIVIDDQHNQHSPQKVAQQQQRVTPIILTSKSIKRDPDAEPPTKHRRIKLEPTDKRPDAVPPVVQPLRIAHVKQEALLRDEAEASEDDVYDGYGETDSVAGDDGPTTTTTAALVCVKQERRDETDGSKDGRSDANVRTRATRTTATAVPIPKPTLIARIKQERRDEADNSSSSSSANEHDTPIVRVKQEVRDEATEQRDEADASDDDVYDGYNDDSRTGAGAPVHVKLEPGAAPPALRVKLEPGLQRVAPTPPASDRPSLRLKIFKQHGRHSASVLDSRTESGNAAEGAAARRHERLMAKIRQEVQARQQVPSIDSAQILRIKAERVSPERQALVGAVSPPGSSAMLLNPFARPSVGAADDQAVSALSSAAAEAEPVPLMSTEKAAEHAEPVQLPTSEPADPVPMRSDDETAQIGTDVAAAIGAANEHPAQSPSADQPDAGTVQSDDGVPHIVTDVVPEQAETVPMADAELPHFQQTISDKADAVLVRSDSEADNGIAEIGKEHEQTADPDATELVPITAAVPVQPLEPSIRTTDDLTELHRTLVESEAAQTTTLSPETEKTPPDVLSDDHPPTVPADDQTNAADGVPVVPPVEPLSAADETTANHVPDRTDTSTSSVAAQPLVTSESIRRPVQVDNVVDIASDGVADIPPEPLDSAVRTADEV